MPADTLEEDGDVPSPRSRNMRAIRRVDTRPEVLLRSRLHRAGYRFRKDVRLDLPAGRVRPDITFSRLRVAVFIDGCFWHQCPLHGRVPRSNVHYWGPKLQRNVSRDEQASDRLLADGWSVVRLWEHLPLERAHALVEQALADAALGQRYFTRPSE